MSEPKSQNITWHAHTITPEERAGRNGHKGAVLWFTGLSVLFLRVKKDRRFGRSKRSLTISLKHLWR